MPFPLAGIIGGMIGTRALHAGSVAASAAGASFLKSPIIQGGGFGIGYTSGAYGGYGISNTLDPLGIHKPKYSQKRSYLGLPYGNYGYGGMRRRRRYGYSRYSTPRYGYRRRPYYRRRYY